MLNEGIYLYMRPPITNKNLHLIHQTKFPRLMSILYIGLLFPPLHSPPNNPPPKDRRRKPATQPILPKRNYYLSQRKGRRRRDPILCRRRMNSFIRGTVIANPNSGVEKHAMCCGKRVVGVN
jgi:hypothetical protein